MTKTMVFWICGGERFSGVLATHITHLFITTVSSTISPILAFSRFIVFFPPKAARGKNAQSRAWLARHHKRTRNNSLHYFSS